MPENEAKNTDHNSLSFTSVKTKISKELLKLIEEDPNEIILNERASKIYIKLISIFPSVKTYFIKELCHKYCKDFEKSLNGTKI